MKRKPILILSDFKLNTLVEPILQKQLNEYSAWLVAVAHCAKEKITDKNQANQTHETIRTLFDNYAVSSDIINKRYCIALRKVFAAKPNALDAVKFPELYEDIMVNPRGADITARIELFQKVLFLFLEDCYPQSKTSPDEIVHVNSMGCIIPSPVQRFLTKRGYQETLVTNAFFFGCYGSVPALRIASGSLLNAENGLARNKKSLDIIHTEFLSIHSNSVDISPNSIIANTLFSDGLVKYTMSILPDNDGSISAGLKLIFLAEKLALNSENEMRWDPTPYGFTQFLSKDIPNIVGKNLKDFVQYVCEEVGIDFTHEKSELVFAIHPGGKKILDVVGETLEIPEDKMQLSRKHII